MDNVILRKVEEYSQLLDDKANLKDLTTENNKAIEKCRQELADMMIDDEVPQIVHAGYSFTLQAKTRWNKAAEKEDELFEALRNAGLGDIIKPTVNANTLNSAINNLVEENDDELPEEFEDVLTKYEYNDVARRKKASK